MRAAVTFPVYARYDRRRMHPAASGAERTIRGPASRFYAAHVPHDSRTAKESSPP